LYISECVKSLRRLRYLQFEQRNAMMAYTILRRRYAAPIAPKAPDPSIRKVDGSGTGSTRKLILAGPWPYDEKPA